MKFTKRISLLVLVFTYIIAGLGTKQASAFTPPNYDPISPTLSNVVLNNATLTKEGSLSANVTVQEDYDKYIEIVFLGKDGNEAGRAKVDAINNVKIVKQTIDGRDGKVYTVSVKSGSINISAKNLPLALTDFIAAKDDYTVKLETSNFVPSKTLPAVIFDADFRTLTSTAQTIGLATIAFPGTLNISNDGIVTISIKPQPAYENAKIYLIVLNSYEKEVKRIAIDPGIVKISLNNLGLPSGSYSIFIELTSADDAIISVSTPVTWSVPGQSAGQTPIGTVGSGNGAFPGGVEVTENGAIRITIQKQTYSSTTKFYLVISNSSGNEVKRIRVYPNNPRVSFSSESLIPGAYTLQMEMVNGSDKIHSIPVTWTIAQPQLSIPSGDAFPGTIIVNPDGTYTVTITTKSINRDYTFYVVVLDVDGNEIKRITFDPTIPLTKTINEWNLQTGGYYLVIEVVDSITGGKARSKPKFTTYNGTQDIIVLVDDQLQKYDQTPVNVDGRTLVPLRAIFEALGAKVEWDGATQTVTATKDDTKVILTIGSNEAWVNGNKVILDVPAQLINEKTMVPIRFVSEALGANVQWDNYSHSVIINNKE